MYFKNEMDLGPPYFTPDTPPPPICQKIGRYIIHSSLIPRSLPYSYIYLCYDPIDNKKKVIKFIKLFENRIEMIKNEIEVMRAVHHPNIIKIQDFFRYDAYMCVIIPYAPHRSVLTFLKNYYPGGFPETMAKKIINQMLKAVQCLHGMGIWHRDIKLENFLIFESSPDSSYDIYNTNFFDNSNSCDSHVENNSNDFDDNFNNNSQNTNNNSFNHNNDNNENDNNNNNNHSNFTKNIEISDKTSFNNSDDSDSIDNLNCIDFNRISIVLTDFGFARFFMPDEKSTDFVGTYRYMAPEIVNNQEYDKSVDIWALGVTFYEILTGQSPFPSTENTFSKFLKKIMKGELNKRLLKSKRISKEAQNLIENMCKFNPSDRFTASRAIMHEWIQSQFSKVSAVNEVESIIWFGINEVDQFNPGT